MRSLESVIVNLLMKLNVIIGGRSRGKSLLLWLLCNEIDSLEHDDVYSIIHVKMIIKAASDRSRLEYIKYIQIAVMSSSPNFIGKSRIKRLDICILNRNILS